MVKQLGAYTQLTLAMMIVGSSIVVGKLVIVSFPVFLAAGLRFAIGSMVLLPLLLWQEGAHFPVSKRDWFISFLQALTGAFLFTIFLFFGLKFTNAVEAGIITSTAPAVVGVLSFLFLREKLSLNKNIGITLAVCGVLLSTVAATSPNTEGGAMPWLGNLLVFAAVIGEALFTIFRKLLPKTISPLFTATMMSVFSLILFLPLAIYEGINFNFSGVTSTGWLAIIYYGVMVTAIAFIFWFQGVSQVQASTAAVFTGVMPVSAVIFSYIILHEPFQWSHLWGGLCVLAGLGFIIRESFNKSNTKSLNKGDKKNVYPIQHLKDNVS